MATRKSPAKRPKRRSLKIRSGDHVKVTAGKDRGKTGKVLRVEPARERLFIEGLNMVKRHTKPQQVAGAQSEAAMGGVIEREGPVHISNVMLLDAKGQPTRVRIEREGSKRFRVAKSSGARLE
jgi:large subunit ribosomal protein L24